MIEVSGLLPYPSNFSFLISFSQFEEVLDVR